MENIIKLQSLFRQEFQTGKGNKVQKSFQTGILDRENIIKIQSLFRQRKHKKSKVFSDRNSRQRKYKKPKSFQTGVPDRET